MPGDDPGRTVPELVSVGVTVPEPCSAPPLIVTAAPVPVDVRLPLTVVVPPDCVYGPLFIESVEDVPTVTTPAFDDGLTARDFPPVTVSEPAAWLSLKLASALVPLPFLRFALDPFSVIEPALCTMFVTTLICTLAVAAIAPLVSVLVPELYAAKAPANCSVPALPLTVPLLSKSGPICAVPVAAALLQVPLFVILLEPQFEELLPSFAFCPLSVHVPFF